MLPNLEGHTPTFYGSVTVGERGQISIPAAARRNLEIDANKKLLVFSWPGKQTLMLVKAEAVTEFITTATARLAHFEQQLKAIEPESAPEDRD